MLTLVESLGGMWGMAYTIERAAWPEIEAALESREQQGYARVTANIGLAAGTVAGPVVERVPGLLYVATGDNPYFIGPEALAAGLAEMQAHDPEVTALAALVRGSHRCPDDRRDHGACEDGGLATVGSGRERLATVRR